MLAVATVDSRVAATHPEPGVLPPLSRTNKSRPALQDTVVVLYLVGLGPAIGLIHSCIYINSESSSDIVACIKATMQTLEGMASKVIKETISDEAPVVQHPKVLILATNKNTASPRMSLSPKSFA